MCQNSYYQIDLLINLMHLIVAFASDPKVLGNLKLQCLLSMIEITKLNIKQTWVQ